MGALRSCWQPDRSIQIPRERCTAESFAILAMAPWGWRRQARLLRRNPSKKTAAVPIWFVSPQGSTPNQCASWVPEF